MKKKTKGDLLKEIEELTRHNREIGDFCARLLGMVKAVHAESAKQCSQLRRAISPASRKSRSVFFGICEQLGPYCLDVAEDKPKPETAHEKAERRGIVPKLEVKEGGKDACHSEETGGKVQDSGNGS